MRDIISVVFKGYYIIAIYILTCANSLIRGLAYTLHHNACFCITSGYSCANLLTWFCLLTNLSVGKLPFSFGLYFHNSESNAVKSKDETHLFQKSMLFLKAISSIDIICTGKTFNSSENN